MPKDRDTRKPKGFSFCQYKRKEDAEDAIKGMNGRVSVKNLFCEQYQSVSRNYLWALNTLIGVKSIVCVTLFCAQRKPLVNRVVPTSYMYTLTFHDAQQMCLVSTLCDYTSGQLLWCMKRLWSPKSVLHASVPSSPVTVCRYLLTSRESCVN